MGAAHDHVRQGSQGAGIGQPAARQGLVGLVQQFLRIVLGAGEAQQRGVQGWVRNRRDGSVEAQATGPADAVQSLIDWARRGPPPARVESVEVHSLPMPSEQLAGFVQRDTV